MTNSNKNKIGPSEQAPTYVRSIAPYQSGKPIEELAREYGIGIGQIVKLASNENPLGYSPHVREFIQKNLDEISRYPDSDGYYLKQALSRINDVATDQIVLGNGSNDVLELVARAFLSSSSSAIFSQYAFIVYTLATQAAGAHGISVPALNYGHDLKGMLAAIRNDTKVIFIANPNNPTGTYVNSEQLEAFLQEVPSSILVVLDQAYDEYLNQNDIMPTKSWLAEYPNLLACRSFSKAYGLAGLRVGYGVSSSDVIDLLNRVLQPFNVGSISQLAAAEALKDQDFIVRSRVLNCEGEKFITQAFKTMGIEYIPSKGNFISFRIDYAEEVYEGLLKRGVIVRPIGAYGLEGFLRVSIGLPNENKTFVSVLEQLI